MAQGHIQDFRDGGLEICTKVLLIHMYTCVMFLYEA